MADSLALRVAALLAARGWNQQDLVREAKLNKNTVSDFLTGKTQPSRGTLGKIEIALGLTPGTLAASAPEDPTPAKAATDLTDAELLAELTTRLTAARRELDDLRRRLAEAEKTAGDGGGSVIQLRQEPNPEWVDHVTHDEFLDEAAISEEPGENRPL